MIKLAKKAVLFLFGFLVLLFALVFITNGPNEGGFMGAFNTVRGFATLQSTESTDITYRFGVVNIPTERPGAASSSTGFEFGKLLTTDTTTITVATTSTGFAVTMNQSGRVKGCAFDLQTVPTTGTVSVQIQKNGTLQTGKYCKLPSSSTFAVNGGNDDVSTTDTLLDDNITFVAGDRFGLIASSSNLNAATFDGNASLIIQLDN